MKAVLVCFEYVVNDVERRNAHAFRLVDAMTMKGIDDLQKRLLEQLKREAKEGEEITGTVVFKSLTPLDDVIDDKGDVVRNDQEQLGRMIRKLIDEPEGQP